MLRARIDPRQFLKRLPLFADLAPEQLDMVAAATTELHLPRGRVIFKRGDPCNGFHTVIYGSVKLCFVSTQGDETVVELVGALEGGCADLGAIPGVVFRSPDDLSPRPPLRLQRGGLRKRRP